MPESDERKRRFSWDKLWGKRKPVHVYANIVERAKSYFPDLAGIHVLEVGCGRGGTLLNLAGLGASVKGLDYSDQALGICQRLRNSKGLNDRAEFVQGDARLLPFRANSFDLVYSVGLIEHFEEPSPLLREQERVLKPGGVFIVQVPQKYSVYTLVKKVLMRIGKWPYGVWETEYSEREIMSLTGRTGLVTCESGGYGSFMLALIRHFLVPTLNFDHGNRLWGDGRFGNSLKANIAMDVWVIARKPTHLERSIASE